MVDYELKYKKEKIELEDRDFVTDLATFPSTIQTAIADVTSSMIAMDIIAFDPTGYLRREADTLMNVLDDRIIKGLAKLKEKEFQRFST